MTIRSQVSAILRSDKDTKTQVKEIVQIVKDKGLHIEKQTVNFIFRTYGTVDTRLYNIVESTD